MLFAVRDGCVLVARMVRMRARWRRRHQAKHQKRDRESEHECANCHENLFHCRAPFGGKIA